MRRTLGVLTLSLTALPIFRVSAQGVDRTKPPALPAPPALKLPAVQTTTLPNGLMLAVVEMHKVPVVAVQLLLDAGAARDPSGVPGLATFTATMLQQGAGARSALDVADEAAFLGAQLGTTASFDGASASIHVPKRRLEAGLDLLADVVLRPSFADSEIARQRELRAAQLVQQRDEPVAVANIAFPAIVYGREHPYGHPLNGTDSATARLARERVTEFYRTYYRTNGARLLVVGDVTLVEVRPLAAEFVALASVVTAKTESSLIEFLKELRRIRDETVAPPELAKAKAYLTLGLPGDFETTGGAAARFRELLAFGLPLDYYDHYVDRINAITAADVQRVARQYIDPDHFDIVVVGDKTQIEAGIKALNEGPIVYRDLWGQEVR